MSISIYLYVCVYMTALSESVKMLVAQSCPTLCDMMACSLPGSSVLGILQARILVVFVQLLSRLRLFVTQHGLQHARLPCP